jgi:hypothetical protein
MQCAQQQQQQQQQLICLSGGVISRMAASREPAHALAHGKLDSGHHSARSFCLRAEAAAGRVSASRWISECAWQRPVANLQQQQLQKTDAMSRNRRVLTPLPPLSKTTTPLNHPLHSLRGLQRFMRCDYPIKRHSFDCTS